MTTTASSSSPGQVSPAAVPVGVPVHDHLVRPLTTPVEVARLSHPLTATTRLSLLGMAGALALAFLASVFQLASLFLPWYKLTDVQYAGRPFTTITFFGTELCVESFSLSKQCVSWSDAPSDIADCCDTKQTYEMAHALCGTSVALLFLLVLLLCVMGYRRIKHNEDGSRFGLAAGVLAVLCMASSIAVAAVVSTSSAQNEDDIDYVDVPVEADNGSQGLNVYFQIVVILGSMTCALTLTAWRLCTWESCVERPLPHARPVPADQQPRPAQQPAQLPYVVE